MPVPIEGAYNDGELRCDFTSVDANVLRACTWFKDLVIVEHVPALKAESKCFGFSRTTETTTRTWCFLEIALLADRKDTLTTEKKALDDEQRKLKKEVEDTDQRVAGNKQLLGVEKNTTLEAVIKAEKEKEKLYDTRESLQNQNAATIRALSPLPMRTRVYCSGRHCYCFMLHPIELFSDKGC